jgi:hypothetical protein
MKSKVTGAALMISLSLVATAESGRADDKAKDFYFQQNQQRFINQPLDARMLGMSGSNALTSASALSAAQNPAGLGLMKYGDLSLSYGSNEVTGSQYPSGSKTKDNQNYGQVFGATPINPTLGGLPESGNIGLGWWGRNGDWTNDPNNTNPGAYQLTGAYGKSIGSRTSLGYGLTYQQDSVDSDTHDYKSSESFLHTVGVQHRLDKELTLGSVISIGHGDHRVQHLFDGLESQTVKQMSYGIGVGAEYALDSTAVSGGLDYTLYSNNGNNDPAVNDIVFGGDSMGRAMNVRLGIEQYLVDWLAVRGGYRYAANFKWDYDRSDLQALTGSANYNAVTMGLGVNYDLGEESFVRSVKLDYAAEYRAVGHDDWQHLVSLSSPFDLCM